MEANHIRSCEKGNIILKMNQDNQRDNHDDLESNPMKRRRGRPRKYLSRNVNRGENAVPRDQNVNRQENAPIPPGFAGVNGYQPRQVNPNNNANDLVVGQTVRCVVEASFDAGYLLSVRAGNTENALRGVVFKPGYFIPVGAHHDVAPNVPMIRRNELPLPGENLNQVHGYNPRSWERNEQLFNSHRNGTANLGPSRARHVPPVPIQIAHPLPGNKVVPVVLQPVNLSNGGTVPNHPSPTFILPRPVEASKGKQVPEAGSPSNESKPTHQVLTAGNQVLPSPLTSNQVQPEQISVEKLHDLEKKFTKVSVPCANRLTEAMNRVQSPSRSDNINMKNEQYENSSLGPPLAIVPLQAVLPGQNFQSDSLPKPFQNFRTGKMTELLRAVQENIIENQSQIGEPARGSSPSAEAEQVKKENGHPCPPKV